VILDQGNPEEDFDCRGKHGVIIQDDKSHKPYRIRLDDAANTVWRREQNVIPEPTGYTAEAPKMTAPIADMIQGCYHAPFAGGYTNGTPRVGRLTRAQERQRAREARLSRI
jgi:hypothetical protein